MLNQPELDSTWKERARLALAPTDWALGMRADSGTRISTTGHYPAGISDGDGRVRPANGAISHDACPDLADKATVLCLVAIGRQRLIEREGVRTSNRAQSMASHRLRDALIAWVNGGHLAALAEVAVEVLEATRG